MQLLPDTAGEATVVYMACGLRLLHLGDVRYFDYLHPKGLEYTLKLESNIDSTLSTAQQVRSAGDTEMGVWVPPEPPSHLMQMHCFGHVKLPSTMKGLRIL